MLEGQNVTLSKEPNGVECSYPGPTPKLVCQTTTLGPVTIPSLGLEGGV